jgi:hypothetical protein
MSAPTFKVGELVDLHIRNARVDKLDCPDNDVFATLRFGSWLVSVNLIAPGVTVDRVAPAEWPPRAGDIWADRNGKEWFAVRRISIAGDAIIFRAADDDASNWNEPSEVLGDVGPLALIRRRGPVRA